MPSGMGSRQIFDSVCSATLCNSFDLISGFCSSEQQFDVMRLWQNLRLSVCGSLRLVVTNIKKENHLV